MKYLQVLLVLLSLYQLYGQAPDPNKIEECTSVINMIVAKYNRPFTFLESGLNAGKFTEKYAAAYPESVFIIIDKTPQNKSNFSSLKNVVWLNHQLVSKDVANLSSCEHVDVLLLFDALHIFSEKWEEALQHFQRMAQVIIVELPKSNPDNSPPLFLEEAHRKLLHLSNGIKNEGVSSIYYTLEEKGTFHLIKTTLIHPRKTRWAYEIYSNYNQKYLKKIRPNWTTTTSWFPGINMMTYLMFNGAIPSRSQIIDHIPIDYEHSDWVPNNMLVQGQRILLIDKNDPISTPVIPDGGKRFLDLESKAKKFILTTPEMSPERVRETFISIYNWGNYFDQSEIEE